MDVSVKEYFLSKRPEAGVERAMYNRVIESVTQCDLTMQALCDILERDLTRMRGADPVSRKRIKGKCEIYTETNTRIEGKHEQL